MNRYWLFGGTTNYPHGGFCDFLGSFDSLDDAKHTANHKEFDFEYTCGVCEWWHIFDTETKTIIRGEGKRDSYEFPKLT